MFLTANEETYQDGQIIFEEGSYGDWIYVIESGSIELSKTIDTRKVVLEVLQQGDIFGELGFISKAPRTATAQSIGTTIVGIVDHNFLVDEFNKLSGNFRTILNIIVSRLNRATEIAAQTKLRRTTTRVAKVLSLTYNTREELAKAFTENASKNGIFIKTDKPLPTGDRFYLKLKLPDQTEPITVGCQVSWNRTSADTPLSLPGMGVEFIQISKTDQESLNKELMKIDPGKKK